MQKSTSVLKGFFAAHFFKHSAGIAAFMLLTLSLMSFRSDDKGKKSAAPARDSVTAIINSNIGSQLLGDYSAEPITDRSIFVLKPDIASFVRDYDKKEKEEYTNMKDWAKPYFELYDRILSANGLPVELKYLSVIESNMQNTNVTVSANDGSAVGPWQLMSYEGKRFGLKMGKKYDERTDFAKSTEVASQLMKELYSEFGDWLLVVASYNCGMGRMKKAIAQAGSNDYWKLRQYLPQETQRHVKKFIATHYFFEGGGSWVTVTAKEAATYREQIAKNNEDKNKALLNEISAADVSGKYSAAAIIRSLAIDADLFNKLNPGFDKAVAEGKTYSLKLPQGKMPLFLTNRHQILEQSAQMLITL